MFCWRITKYNPLYRNNMGVYTQDEWTSYSDIDKTFYGDVLTFAEYENTENKYIAAIAEFLACSQVQTVTVTALEKGIMEQKDFSLCTQEMQDLYVSIIANQTISQTMIVPLARLVLRELLWCKLESEELYIHFGYDYYLYIGVKKKCDTALESIKNQGLFVEHSMSPYYDKYDAERRC